MLLVLLAQVWIRSVVQQQTHEDDVAGLGRAHERRRALAQRLERRIVVALQDRTFERGVRVGSAIEQKPGEVNGAKLPGRLDGRTAVHELQRVHVDCGIQRRHPSRVGDVRIRATFEQQRGDVVVGVDDGEDQTRSRRPRRLD